MPARPIKLFKLVYRVYLRHSEAFRRSSERWFNLRPLKFLDDPRDEDVAFFYAEEANHDAEEAIFQELYGTTTTTVPGA